MIDNSLLRDIESPRFRFAANQAASPAHFIELVTDQLSFSRLVDGLRPDSQAQADLMSYFARLAGLDTDYRYENPYDTALAAYVLAFRAAGSPYALSAAASLASTQRLWWADRIAANVIAENKHVTMASEQSSYIPTAAKLLVYASHFSSTVGDVYTLRVPTNTLIHHVLLSKLLVVQYADSVHDPNPIRSTPNRAQMSLFARDVMFTDQSSNLSADYEVMTA